MHTRTKLRIVERALADAMGEQNELIERISDLTKQREKLAQDADTEDDVKQRITEALESCCHSIPLRPEEIANTFVAEEIMSPDLLGVLNVANVQLLFPKLTVGAAWRIADAISLAFRD